VRSLAGTLLTITGVFIILWVLDTPGDQIAVACIGGLLTGLGISMVVYED
jgi:uncharacterized membrane-anchored protein YitT (DUF2179 family)